MSQFHYNEYWRFCSDRINITASATAKNKARIFRKTMKKIISLLLLLLVIFSAPVMLSSNATVLLRALHQTDEININTLMMPGWLADLKLRTIGIGDCSLSLTEKNDTGPVINFLVAAYADESVNKDRVKKYIRLFSRQGCSVNEYDLAGMTPLHAAVLFYQPELVKVLLANNADITKKINRPGKKVDGMQPLKFARYLAKSNSHQGLRDIINILQNRK